MTTTILTKTNETQTNRLACSLNPGIRPRSATRRRSARLSTTELRRIIADLLG